MNDLRCVVGVPDEVAAAWMVPASLDVGETDVWVDVAHSTAEPLLLAAQATLLSVSVTDVDADGRLGSGSVRFERWVCTPRGPEGRLGVLVSSPFGPTGWVSDDPGSIGAVLAALAAAVHPAFAEAPVECTPPL